MQKIQPPVSSKKMPGNKNLWQDWNWKLSDGDGKKTIALIKSKVKEQVKAALKGTKKKRKVTYEWTFRVKIFLKPPATFAQGAAGTTDPPNPKQPPPPSM